MNAAAGIMISLPIAGVIIYALVKKVNVYKAFIEGAGSALPQLASILPALAAMLAAINLLRVSGAVELLTRAASPLLEALGIPNELAPLVLLRPFSGSASLAMVRDTFTQYGADGYIGRAAAVLVGSTETVFYTMAVYFGAVGVTKTRHALPASLIAGAVGAVAGVWLVRIL